MGQFIPKSFSDTLPDTCVNCGKVPINENMPCCNNPSFFCKNIECICFMCSESFNGWNDFVDSLKVNLEDEGEVSDDDRTMMTTKFISVDSEVEFLKELLKSYDNFEDSLESGEFSLKLKSVVLMQNIPEIIKKRIEELNGK